MEFEPEVMDPKQCLTDEADIYKSSSPPCATSQPCSMHYQIETLLEKKPEVKAIRNTINQSAIYVSCGVVTKTRLNLAVEKVSPPRLSVRDRI